MGTELHPPETATVEPFAKGMIHGHTRTRVAYWALSVSVLVTVLLCLAVVLFWDEVRSLSNYGYVGVILISVFAGGTMIVPVPALPIVFTMGSVLSPALVGASAGFGEAIGAMFIYVTGYQGRAVVDGAAHPAVSRIVKWVQKRGAITIFLMSSFFDPFFFPATIAIGAMRYQAWRFFLATWAGKTVKGMIVAYLGYLGLGAILRTFGIAV